MSQQTSSDSQSTSQQGQKCQPLGEQTAANQQSSTQHPLDPSQGSSTWCGFKIFGDNIDKCVHCRHMQIWKQTQSLHYFHSYAVQDRVGCSNLSDDPKSSPATAKDDIDTVLPTVEDDAILHHDFAILVARILCKHMSFSKIATLMLSTGTFHMISPKRCL